MNIWKNKWWIKFLKSNPVPEAFGTTEKPWGDPHPPWNTAFPKHNAAGGEVLSMTTEGPLSVASLRAQRRCGAETHWEWRHKPTWDSCRDWRRLLGICASVRTKNMYCPKAWWWEGVYMDESKRHLSLENRADTGISLEAEEEWHSLIPDQEESLNASSEAGALFCSQGEPRPFTPGHILAEGKADLFP